MSVHFGLNICAVDTLLKLQRFMKFNIQSMSQVTQEYNNLQDCRCFLVLNGIIKKPEQRG